MRTDFVDYTVDANPHKQGQLLPGTHIPIRPLETLRETRPDVVLILPWNLREEIIEQHAYIREWGGRFAARAPELRLLAMIVRDAPLDGVCVVEQERFADERGFFARTYDVEALGPGRADEHVVQRQGRHAARPALPGRAARGGQARALHPRGDLGRGGRPARRTRRPAIAGTPSS